MTNSECGITSVEETRSMFHVKHLSLLVKKLGSYLWAVGLPRLRAETPAFRRADTNHEDELVGATFPADTKYRFNMSGKELLQQEGKSNPAF